MNAIKKVCLAVITSQVGIIFLVLVLIIGSPIFFGFFMNWVAERDAKAFCSGIEIGSNIEAAISKFKERGKQGVFIMKFMMELATPFSLVDL